MFLELPIDVLFNRVDEGKVMLPRRVRPDAAPAPTAQAVEETLQRLTRAPRPAIVAGGGVWFSGAAADLVAFAEQTGIPVFSTGKAHGIVPADHKLCGRSAFGLAALAAGGMPPDVVLLLGARLGLFTGGRGGGFIAAAELIQVDIEGEEIGRNRDVELGIVADCRETLRALHAAAHGRSWPDLSAWQQTVSGAAGMAAMMFAGALEATSGMIHPYRLAHDVAHAAGPDAVLVGDGGETAS